MSLFRTFLISQPYLLKLLYFSLLFENYRCILNNFLTLKISVNRSVSLLFLLLKALATQKFRLRTVQPRI